MPPGIADGPVERATDASARGDVVSILQAHHGASAMAKAVSSADRAAGVSAPPVARCGNLAPHGSNGSRCVCNRVRRARGKPWEHAGPLNATTLGEYVGA
jgi:hypothetical protein